jgi:hypothetical protein
MKTTSIIKTAVAAAVLYQAAASADTFTYNTGDLLAAFRKPGSSYDLIVDVGSASVYQNAANGNSFNITGVDSTLLTSVFGNMDGIYWSVFGYMNTNGSSLGARNTIWVTDPRWDAAVQNDPNSSLTVNGQGTVISKMIAIANGAISGTVVSDQIVDVSSSLNIGGNPVSYTIGVGSLGDFRGTWAPDIENLTPAGFASSSPLVPHVEVSDLFQQDPGANNVGSYLGDFQLNNDGTLVFNPVPEPSTSAMFGAGMLMLVSILRRRGAKNI